MSLETAPDEIKLAVDLILMLEQQQLETHVILAALDIAKKDFQKKRQLAMESSSTR